METFRDTDKNGMTEEISEESELRFSFVVVFIYFFIYLFILYSVKNKNDNMGC